MQQDIFSVLYEKYIIKKPIRLIELFGGYGSQHLALKYLGVDVEHWKLVEWAVKSIQAYKDIHCKNETDYSKNMTKEELIDYLHNKGISMNYNEPMTLQQIRRKNEEWLKTVYNNIIATKNQVNIQQVKGKDLEIVDTDKYEYIMTYSFPCITDDSLILSNNGYVCVKDLNVGDKVLTKSNTWQKVSKKFDNGKQQTFYLNAMGFENIQATAQHKFLVRSKQHIWDKETKKQKRIFTETRYEELKNIKKGDYLGIPIIQEENHFYTDDLDFWYMIGAYLGDGWLSNDGYDIRFGLNEKKIEQLAPMIKKYNYKTYQERTCIKMRFANKEIYNFIKKHIGTGSNVKRIPYEILCLPKPQLEKVIEGYLMTDGSYTQGVYKVSTINKSLAYSFMLMVNKVYKTPTRIYKIKNKKTHQIEDRIVNQQDCYQVVYKRDVKKQDKAFVENNYIWYPFRSIEKGKVENVYNIEVENDHSYVLQGCVSKNCQDLSLAGKRAGMSDTSTRSGLLWEVERILDECEELPQILLMENVPQVIGKGNVEHFNKWQSKLEKLDYKNYHQNLIATDYGIPQTRNRTFMISILGDYSYTFPKPIPLKLKLKDMLEDNVDEKYYLSEKAIKGMLETNYQQGKYENRVQKDVCSTIMARDYKDAKCVEVVGTYQYSKSDNFMQGKNRFQQNKNTVDTLQTTPKEGVVYNSNNIYNLLFTIFDLCCIINTKEKDKYERSRELLQILWQEIGKKEIWEEIRRFVSIQEKEILQSNLYENGIYEDRKLQSKVSTSTSNSSEYNESITNREEMLNMWEDWKTRYTPQRWELSEQQFRQFNLFMQELSYETTQRETSMQNMWQTNERFRILQQTLFKIQEIWRPIENKISNGLRVRKLTPRETFRLMGVKDEDYEKIAKNQSNSSLYHLAGDSIVVDVLMAIFKELLRGD